MKPLYLSLASALSASLRWLLSFWLCLHDHEIFRRKQIDGPGLPAVAGWECMDCLKWRPLHPELVEGSPLETRIKTRQFSAHPADAWLWHAFRHSPSYFARDGERESNHEQSEESQLHEVQ